MTSNASVGLCVWCKTLLANLDNKLQCKKIQNKCSCTCAELHVYVYAPILAYTHIHHMTWFRYTGTIKDLAPNKQSNWYTHNFKHLTDNKVDTHAEWNAFKQVGVPGNTDPICIMRLC